MNGYGGRPDMIGLLLVGCPVGGGARFPGSSIELPRAGSFTRGAKASSVANTERVLARYGLLARGILFVQNLFIDGVMCRSQNIPQSTDVPRVFVLQLRNARLQFVDHLLERVKLPI